MLDIIILEIFNGVILNEKKTILLNITITVFLFVIIFTSNSKKIIKEGLLLNVLDLNVETIEKITLSYGKNTKLLETNEEINELINIINQKVVFQKKYKEETDGEAWIIQIIVNDKDILRLSLTEAHIRWKIKSTTYLYNFSTDINTDFLNKIIIE